MRSGENFKATENGSYSIEDTLKQWRKRSVTTPLIEGYLCCHVTIHVHLFGKVRRNGREGPAKDLCMTFQRNPRRSEAKPVLMRKARFRDGGYYRPYNMKVAVLVDVVEARKRRKLVPDVEELVVPSVVWLQDLTSASLAEVQTSDLLPGTGVRSSLSSASALGRGDGQDGESRTSFYPRRDPSFEPSEMQLKDQVIESRPSIEQTVPCDKSEVSPIENWNLPDVEAVFKSFSVNLRGSGIEVGPTADAELGSFRCEGFAVFPATPPFLPPADEVARHGPTLHHHEPCVATSPVFRQTLLGGFGEIRKDQSWSLP